jgi:Zn-dependent metalloprotease
MSIQKISVGCLALLMAVLFGSSAYAVPAAPVIHTLSQTLEEAARGFLSTYGSLFGLVDQARELSVMHTKSTDQGRSFVRFQQVHSGIPVLGGGLIVQVNSSNNIILIGSLFATEIL